MLINQVLSLRERRRLRRIRSRDRQTILDSGLFDAEWYVARYPDVATYIGGPLDHFLEHGAKEGRLAGPGFDTASYLAANPDVIATGANPLIHYIRHGIVEGRGFAPKAPSLSRRRGHDVREVRDPTFSILLRHGASADVEVTLKALLAQRRATFALILPASDGQTSRTLEALRVGGGSRKGVVIHQVAATEGGFLHAGFALAENDFVILLDPGDAPEHDALADLAVLINRCEYENRRCDLVYSDEAQVLDGSPEPVLALKPAWSPELLAAYNYFGRITAIRRTVAAAALADVGQGPAEEWDLNLRVTERTQAIERLPKVICRRTVSATLDRRLSASAPSDHAAILAAYWGRRGHDARVTPQPDGTFRSTWPLKRRPLVSIIIPNKDRAHLLGTCAHGIYEINDYRNFELIVVDNGSTEQKTLKLYADLIARGVRVIDFDEEFNYSRACNVGASQARGELLLFLNNDIEMVRSDWLEELVRQALEPGVGVVGAKLLYPDGGIQHAGVALGLFTLAAHVFHRAPHDDWGPIGSPDVQRNWMAVTGACQLIPRAVFDLVNGYDETFLISYSDVVMGIDAARAGFRSVYLPSAVLVHHEGASRGHTNPSNDQVLFAKRVRALGIVEDPYFHPALDTLSFAPKLRGGEASGQGAMQADIDRLVGPPARTLDIFDDGAVATAVGLPWATISWRFDPTNMTPGLDAAARILVEFVRRRPDLRTRFPKALRDGAAGGFAVWVKTEGLRLLGLDAAFVPWIDAAFDAGFGSSSRQALLYEEGVRRNHPLFLLPNGRAAACGHLFHALRDETLAQEDLWWFLVESAEDPIAELCATWAVTPAWQTDVPDGGTVFGITRLCRWVAATYGVIEDWIYEQTYPAIMSDAAQIRLAYGVNAEWRADYPDAMTDETCAVALIRHLASRASGLSALARGWVAQRDPEVLAREVVRPGVNILGHFSYPSGLRISTESIVEGLRENEVGISMRDVPINIMTDDPIGHAFNGFEIHDTTIIHVQPEPVFDQAYDRAGLLPRSERTYRIGYWYWEFDEVPSSWNRAALDCDEFWTATEFIAKGLRAQYKQPVHVFMPGIEIAPFERKLRADFGLKEDEFVFLFVFHMTSIMDRKNPFGLIKAFKEAFGPEDKAKLVIKTSFADQQPEAFARLQAAVTDSNAVLINRTFSRDETLSLIQACDAYVSLHRSEGLGLSMAEAMLLGRPVIATRYSGNLDFMDDSNSLLVDYRITTLNHDLTPYKAGQRWAQPSVAHAAIQMRRLYEDPAFARELGARGRADLEKRLNYKATGAAIAARLKAIRDMA